ncbi:MAG: FAD binding domain-containing protein [Geminicoccaceae bacterium]
MYEFAYHKPTSVADAVSLLKNADDPALMAGGQTLLPTLKQRLAQPSDLIDLGGIAELKGIREEAGKLVIGAMTRHGEIAKSGLVKERIPGLAQLAGWVGDPQVRNLGTIGGSVSNNDPAADYPAALVALNATVQTDQRQIAAEDFFTGMFETALNEDELLTAVHFPIPEKSAYQKFRNPASRYAMTGVMVAVVSGNARVAVTGAGASVFRASDIEQALSSNFSPEAVDGVTIDPSGLNEDIHGSAEYRANLVKVMAKRAVAEIV